MQTRHHVLSIATILSLAAWCGADSDPYLFTDGSKVSLPWRKTDGAGFVWDIHGNGNVEHGTNYAYSNAMMLTHRSSRHFHANNISLVSRDGQELLLGPYKDRNLRVWRRIYIDPKLGYARWIDIFKNVAKDTPIKLDVQYQNYMGNSIRKCTTTTGEANLTSKDWGFVTADEGNNNRPAVMQVFATRRSKIHPTVQVQMNNNQFFYRINLTIPPGETKSLCFF